VLDCQFIHKFYWLLNTTGMSHLKIISVGFVHYRSVKSDVDLKKSKKKKKIKLFYNSAWRVFVIRSRIFLSDKRSCLKLLSSGMAFIWSYYFTFHLFLFACRRWVLLPSTAHILGTTLNSVLAISCGLLIHSRLIRFLSYFVALISFTHNFCNLLLPFSFIFT
jgi:hypothetical protein